MGLRICQPHWGALKQAIKDRGLYGLVSKSGEAAMESMVAQIEGQDTKADFDPLMNANWAITGQYLKDVGLAGFEGEKCPLCEVEKSKEGRAQNWIDGASDEQLTAARQLELVPKAA